jgi:release factor glutamine methyltransferase
LLVRELLRREKDIGRTDLVAIVAFVLGATRERIYMDPGRELAGAALEDIERHVAERKKGKPLSYITRTREFFSEEFLVDERVLVPRPETELLVEEALRIMAEKTGRERGQESGHASQDTGPHILDMGTGSGIIGIILARHGAAAVTCVDISGDALLVARENAARLGVQDRTACVRSDLFTGISRSARFDIIVANLPYVSAPEWEELTTDVKFEPRTALLGGILGTEIYERFVGELPGHLKEDGFVLCELGGAAQIEAVGKLMKGRGLRVDSKKDLAGRDRILIGSWKNLS